MKKLIVILIFLFPFTLNAQVVPNLSGTTTALSTYTTGLQYYDNTVGRWGIGNNGATLNYLMYTSDTSLSWFTSYIQRQIATPTIQQVLTSGNISTTKYSGTDITLSGKDSAANIVGTINVVSPIITSSGSTLTIGAPTSFNTLLNGAGALTMKLDGSNIGTYKPIINGNLSTNWGEINLSNSTGQIFMDMNQANAKTPVVIQNKSVSSTAGDAVFYSPSLSDSVLIGKDGSVFASGGITSKKTSSLFTLASAATTDSLIGKNSSGNFVSIAPFSYYDTSITATGNITFPVYAKQHLAVISAWPSVTTTISVGTTLGGSDVVAATSVTGGTHKDFNIGGSEYSRSATTTLYITSSSGTSSVIYDIVKQ